MATKLKIAKEIFNLIYPVGSIYISTNTTNPSTLFGGSWERVKGKFLLGADDNTYINGATGGEATHTLTINEMPEHDHKNAYAFDNVKGQNAPISGTLQRLLYAPSNWYGALTNKIGGNQAHNNMPPYLAVYIWKRTN